MSWKDSLDLTPEEVVQALSDARHYARFPYGTRNLECDVDDTLRLARLVMKQAKQIKGMKLK